MTNLKEQIEQYVARRREFQELEELVMKQIRGIFDLEIDDLNKKLPLEYHIRKYNVCPPERFPSRVCGDERHKKPRIVIPVECSSDVFNKVQSFNELLAEDYKRFEEKYGVIVEGFMPNFQMG